MQEEKNPLLCDIDTGICEIAEDNSTKNAENFDENSKEKSVKIIYFTDPICSSCWGIEPQLRKLKLEYGNDIEIEYRMGGLLKDWSYNSGGISKPSDVAEHWDEVSAHYDMPIDGDIWLENPLHSSYPPSIAFKAAQIQDEKKAQDFLREIKEMVFLQKKNICDWENLAFAAEKCDLNMVKFKEDYENAANLLFQEDLNFARKLGVRGFPTLFFINNEGKSEIMYGVKPYESYEAILKKINPSIKTESYKKDWESLFSKFETMTALEFSVLSGINRSETDAILDQLLADEKIEKFNTKNGSIWTCTKANS
ncbi:DsbA family protein [Frigoriflavimonas asaccharolytica]|uniref:Putative DsbA family dithiol-disulfide isomerase n=1 Tax=Frigoriflavimonas asaccharolytica TaxID=2735899 RepID=A0A8J8G5H6_9FLAO|nr:DsbA family protein [Frigoriflavimonas asaccharolytica]NRS91508.1 putative DsbA family dithiol-disulfide isomerase [Frigoriflavimonas asaccharolytica]